MQLFHEAVEGGTEDERRRSGVGEDEREFVGHEAPVEGDDDATGLGRAEERLDELGPVHEQRRHPVAPLHVEIAQGVRDTIASLVEFHVVLTSAARDVHHRVDRGAELGPLRDEEADVVLHWWGLLEGEGGKNDDGRAYGLFVPIDAVVFDLGNVLVRWDRRLLYEKLIADPHELDRFLDTVLTLDVNADLDRGTPLAEVTESLARRHPGDRDLIDAFRERWPETLGEILTGSVAILEELRTTGLKLLALSNWGSDTFDLAQPELPFLRHFDHLVISGREGVVKPDPAIFELMCDRHQVVPSTAVFIDDSAANIATADALGFATIHFASPSQCRAELIDLGLDLVPGAP